jgi:hypothetical protein
MIQSRKANGRKINMKNMVLAPKVSNPEAALKIRILKGSSPKGLWTRRSENGNKKTIIFKFNKSINFR